MDEGVNQIAGDVARIFYTPLTGQPKLYDQY